MRIVMAQINLLMGDISGNAQRVIDAALEAQNDFQADVIIFPELTLTGYPPEDLLLRRGFYRAVEQGLAQILKTTLAIDIVLGYPRLIGKDRFNAASLLRGGDIVATYHKQCLPNYSVFDEKRYFSEGASSCVVDICGVAVALTICEDVWEDGPVRHAVENGAQLIFNLNASPFHIEKWRQREAIVCALAKKHRVPVIYTNLVGGQDELVFDGQSFVVNADGKVMVRARSFAKQLVLIECDDQGAPARGELADEPSADKSVYDAVVLGVRDYVKKNGFAGVVLGLSGGIDSALTLVIAVDAVGADKVEAVMMPSRYTRKMSITDAREQVEQLGVSYSTIEIEDLFEQFKQALADRFVGLDVDTTEENLQARIRGVLLMAISNKSGKIVLTTGNKSEMAVGYATLYGDMAGGFAAIKDLPKTLVYRLARYRNQQQQVIPQRVIERAPSAELGPNQKDTDSLPPYEVLDEILERYVERDKSAAEIVRDGYDAKTVSKVIRLVDRNEYKRRQAAPGVRVTSRAFGRDRRYPITSAYQENES